ncbi:hypothetical protein DSM104299_03597 [Baekduia alba]|uniref:glycoside hydrolase family 38 N-terminal domain-containing protein n=1 Tax=Baekduia alba TaxID=2997333 RepID=UPI0023401AF3|nr:glycoside hydrolase family 38 C-terminal domain-containing protein [Baekduia alba]WCB94857.1 hypothetical protein DSM104299_03597 [Baekduia alba]
MSEISTIYIANHSHTDIGYTDYQSVCFRQHAEYVGQALDLIEATADRPDESRYRWTVEVTGPMIRYLRGAGNEEVDRFRHWQREGAIDIAAMQYNLTPGLTPEQMHRSLYPVRVLREEFGLTVETAMQDDVNGMSWLFADLLPAIGVDFLTLAVNQVRGRAPKPFPGAFWWEGPAGGRLLAWNGFHYLFGRSQAKLGDWRFVDENLPRYVQDLEAREDWPYDFLYCESTHPVRVDNGPPDPRMADFVHRWNEEGRGPKMAFTTPRLFGRAFRDQWGDSLPTWRGDWTDWWSDGVGSSSYETGVNRGTHELAASAEMLGAWLRAEGVDGWDTDRARQIYEHMTLYDEHTWGAFSSVEAPAALWSRSQWSHKSHYAYDAAMETHDVLARVARGLAETRATPGPEGMFNLGDLETERAYPEPESRELMVVNTLPWERDVLVEVPERRAGGAPVGMLETFFPRGVPWGFPPETEFQRVRAKVPAFGYAFVGLDDELDAGDLRAEGHVIENEHYRVELDPATGTVSSWLDKALGHDFAGEQHGWRIGEYVYETLTGGADRSALFVMDFAHDDFGTWPEDPPFQRETATQVEVGPARIQSGRASIEVKVQAPGVSGATCTFSLDAHTKELAVDWLLDKVHHADPESVYIAFPFNLDGAEFRVDLNGVPCTPNDDQLPGTARDWFPIRRWADVSDGERGVTVVPLDAPLVQLGGITTGKAAADLEPEGPAIVSWALNNHWMVNFQPSQGGQIPQRYRLTTHAGACDAAVAGRFAAGAATPPVILRDYLRTGDPTGALLQVEGDLGVEVGIKPAEDGDGAILRLRNVTPAAVTVPLRFLAAVPTSANVASPLEEDGDPLTVTDGAVSVPLAGSGTATVRVRF